MRSMFYKDPPGKSREDGLENLEVEFCGNTVGREVILFQRKHYTIFLSYNGRYMIYEQ